MNESIELNQELLLKLPQELPDDNEPSLTNSFVLDSLCKTREVINSLVMHNTSYLQSMHELSDDDILSADQSNILKYSRLSDIVQQKSAIDLYISMFEEEDSFTPNQLQKYYKTFKIIRNKVESYLFDPFFCGNHSPESVKEHFLEQKNDSEKK